MTDATHSVPHEDLRTMFDLVVNSLDFGSGFLSTDEMRTLDRVGQMVGAPRVRCGAQDHMPDQYSLAHCALPIGHHGRHEFMGAACPVPLKANGRNERTARYLRLVELARGSGVRPLTERMI